MCIFFFLLSFSYPSGKAFVPHGKLSSHKRCSNRHLTVALCIYIYIHLPRPIFKNRAEIRIVRQSFWETIVTIVLQKEQTGQYHNSKMGSFQTSVSGRHLVNPDKLIRYETTVDIHVDGLYPNIASNTLSSHQREHYTYKTMGTILSLVSSTPPAQQEVGQRLGPHTYMYTSNTYRCRNSYTSLRTCSIPALVGRPIFYDVIFGHSIITAHSSHYHFLLLIT